MVDIAEGLRVLDRRLIGWIRRMHAQGAQLYAACGGSLVLAEAGLLDGQAGDDALGLCAAVPQASFRT